MTLHASIAPALARALAKKGYERLTEVQEAVLAPEADGADLLVSAQTGSGKTVAFGIAIAPTVLDGAETFPHAQLPLALVVAPTRELALQVQRELIWLYGEAAGRIAACVGGMDARAERRALERGAHIVVGTPGRLRDHIERGALDLSDIRAVVLDEADEMLDFGFREDLEFILDAAPSSRRTLLFSATVSKAISDIARRYQKDAVRVSTVSERGQHADIAYQALLTAPSDRENAIINTLRFHDAARALVFCATREMVNRLTSRLRNRGFLVVALSGELTQNERTHALQALRDGRAKVCVATDVAARGIDLPGLDLVIHADLPTNGETLLHRSGRTGRAGAKGISALIVPMTQRGRAMRLLKSARIEAEWTEPPSADAIRARDHERLMSDPALTEEHDAELMESAKALLERFSAEQIAAAFLAAKQAVLPSAEELLSAPEPVRGPREGRDQREPRPARAPFRGGVWFEVNVGHKQRAEPRWLLPLICRLGHVTRNEVGAIEISDTRSRFEISGDAVEKFAEALIATRGTEKSVRIVREGEGGVGESAADARPRKPREDRPREERPREDRSREDRPQEKRSFERRPREDKPRDDRPREDRPREERPRRERPAGEKRWSPHNDVPADAAPERRDDAGDRTWRRDGKPERKPLDPALIKPRERKGEKSGGFKPRGSAKPGGGKFKPKGKGGPRRDHD